ncbi:hypothetical protein DFP72DRAFT_852026 [Ephemerocybe angulata]|uniref:Uncharacterized protein n=1 Tax=Ephemerocybe angulata TaxID=980116 RepID=A0A8H6HP16_9AGAR|nr:hypothetical protein DFP72DRAFT_852026 [Tulosesus angulatus]
MGEIKARQDFGYLGMNGCEATAFGRGQEDYLSIIVYGRARRVGDIILGVFNYIWGVGKVGMQSRGGASPVVAVQVELEHGLVVVVDVPCDDEQARLRIFSVRPSSSSPSSPYTTAAITTGTQSTVVLHHHALVVATTLDDVKPFSARARRAVRIWALRWFMCIRDLTNDDTGTGIKTTIAQNCGRRRARHPPMFWDLGAVRGLEFVVWHGFPVSVDAYPSNGNVARTDLVPGLAAWRRVQGLQNGTEDWICERVATVSEVRGYRGGGDVEGSRFGQDSKVSCISTAAAPGIRRRLPRGYLDEDGVTLEQGSGGLDMLGASARATARLGGNVVLGTGERRQTRAGTVGARVQNGGRLASPLSRFRREGVSKAGKERGSEAGRRGFVGADLASRRDTSSGGGPRARIRIPWVETKHIERMDRDSGASRREFSKNTIAAGMVGSGLWISEPGYMLKVQASGHKN